MTSRGARWDTKGHRIVGFMVKPFTPIHTKPPMLLTRVLGVFVWGCHPRGIAENSSPSSDGLEALQAIALG